MAHLAKNTDKLLARVRRIQGQLKAVERKLEEGADCMATLQQIAAVRGASHGLLMEVLEAHMREHLLEGKPQQRAEELDEIIRLLQRYVK
ncbi:metal/formaldehyde-sensitive transcriptional repressor [Simiduia agarivorans]|uniref:Metal/formaldehyde-sensitive transcriptional repressor n=1 Tax=Simiduia agarivorans (strain DSM 21679 / JCM 13881 / BCRC 17597 / SA1) TaxID=1117647 RepID=K4L3S2_SIMAS|nr:metal/formaldehyde-sensitive transcriptional repressor [Simiduia agarivorans]AFV00858.1 hypothetical protein M5M_18645 [Simiduia agarivorans SA1 = DSM 21679]